MHATVRSYTASGGLLDALIENQDEVRRLISEIDGFHGYYLVRTADGGMTSISVFADGAGADESTRRAAEWISENAADVSPGAPEISEGEVVLTF